MDICPFFQEQVNQYTHFETLLYIHTQATTYIYRTSEQKCLQFSIKPPHLPGSWAIPICARTTYGRGSTSYKNQRSPVAQRGCSNLCQLQKVALVRISELFWVQRKDALFACQTKDLKCPLLGAARYGAFGNGAARRARGCAAPAVSWAPAPPKAPGAAGGVDRAHAPSGMSVLRLLSRKEPCATPALHWGRGNWSHAGYWVSTCVLINTTSVRPLEPQPLNDQVMQI